MDADRSWGLRSELGSVIELLGMKENPTATEQTNTNSACHLPANTSRVPSDTKKWLIRLGVTKRRSVRENLIPYWNIKELAGGTRLSVCIHLSLAVTSGICRIFPSLYFMVLGRLVHYAADAVLVSTVLAGIKRSTGFA